jgi:hypothetical protein
LWGAVEGVAFKLGLSVILSIMLFVLVLPVVIFIVYFNKSYIFSIIIAFIYSVLNFGIGLNMISFAPNSTYQKSSRFRSKHQMQYVHLNLQRLKSTWE